MISIRKFLAAGDDASAPDELRRIIRLLIQGVGLHAVEGDPQEYQAFRRDIQQQLEAVEANPATADLLVATGGVLKALEGYNTRATRHLRMQGAELQHMVAMLTRAVATLGSGSEKSLGRLREIEAQIEKTSAIEDVRVLKLRLGDCLESIRSEATRQKNESSRAVETLNAEIQQSQQRISIVRPAPAHDPATGLPARDAAIAALTEWSLQANPPFAGLFMVDRVPLINARFGYAVGDRVLKIYLEELRKHLAPADQVFRWSGPAFVVLLNRPDPIEKVREQLRYTVPGKVERNFELSNRSAMLSISATWAIFAVSPPVENLIEQLDGFLTIQNPA